MSQHASDADLDRLSWHDNTIYGFRFDLGASGFTQKLRAAARA